MPLFKVEAETAVALSSWLVMAESADHAIDIFNKETLPSITVKCAYRFFLGENEVLKIATYIKHE